MNLLVLFLICYLTLAVTSFNIDEDLDAITDLTTTEMISKFGYPLEVHTIQTKDGYILDLHRIPFGKSNKTVKLAAPPVLIYAGLLGDSACFACWSPDSSIGYILADQGYDVWLGNTRGTTHGKKHIKLDPYKDEKKFWNFSFQEIATYDVPASINYILNITNSRNLYYIGHSQGSTIAFAMLSEKPTYNKKIRLLIGLAPIVNMKHSATPIPKLGLKDFLYYKALVKKYNIYEVMPLSHQIKQLLLLYYNNNSPIQDVCIEFICLFVGCNYENINQKYVPIMLSNLPAGASIKQLVHYMQLLEGEFKKYDYGKEKNIKIYNSEMPPIYNLSKIRVKTAFFYGTTDIIAAYQDVEILATKLRKLIYKKRIENFNHVDLLYATDTNDLINMDIVNLLKIY